MICFPSPLNCASFNYVLLILSLLFFSPCPLQVAAHACKQLQHHDLSSTLHISLIITNISHVLQSASSPSSSSASASSSPPSAAATSSECPAPLQPHTIDAKLRLSGLHFHHAPLLLHSMRLLISAEVHGSSGSDAFGAETSTDSRVITAHGGGGSSRCDASGAREGRHGGRETCASGEGGLSREEEERARVDFVVKVRRCSCGSGGESNGSNSVSRAISLLPISASARVSLPPIPGPHLPPPHLFRLHHRLHPLCRSPRHLILTADV